MTKQNKSAFPVSNLIEKEERMGMTKREYFAALFLQGILSSGIGGTIENKIGCAVDASDALITELEDKDE